MALLCGCNPRDFCQWRLDEMIEWGMTSAETLKRFMSKEEKEAPDLIDQFGRMAADLDSRNLFGVKRGK